MPDTEKPKRQEVDASISAMLFSRAYPSDCLILVESFEKEHPVGSFTRSSSDLNKKHEHYNIVTQAISCEGLRALAAKAILPGVQQLFRLLSLRHKGLHRNYFV